MKTTHEDKKQLILASARKLLVRKQFQDDAVALDDVAKAAKVAKGTLFLYYKNKDELFRAAFADLVEQLAAELEKIKTEPLKGRARLERVVRAILEHLERHKDFLSQIARFPGCRLAENHARVGAILEGCVADGVLPGRDLGFAASNLFGLCRSALIYKLISGKDEGMDARVSRVTDTFLYGQAGRR